MSTVTLSPMPDWTAATSVPRLVGIEHPLGVTLGHPGDVARQTAVLRDTLQALAEMETAGDVRYLPYKWTELPGDPSLHPSPPPPITLKISFRSIEGSRPNAPHGEESEFRRVGTQGEPGAETPPCCPKNP